MDVTEEIQASPEQLAAEAISGLVSNPDAANSILIALMNIPIQVAAVSSNISMVADLTVGIPEATARLTVILDGIAAALADMRARL